MMPAGGFTQAFGGWAGPKLECVEFPVFNAILCWCFILAYSDSNTQDRRDRRGTAAGTAASPPAKGRRAAPSAVPRGPAELAPAVPRAVRGRSAGGPKGGLRRGF